MVILIILLINNTASVLKKMCNLLDRLAYAHLTTNAIEKKEVANFGWYIESIVNHTRVVKYCENNGFEDIIKLSECY